MEDILQNILSSHSKTKTLKEYEEIVNKSGMMWKKPHEYNTPIAGNLNFDDFFKLAGHGEVKLCKFIVKCLSRGANDVEYVRSIQFFYKSASGQVIEGYQQIHPAVSQKGTLVEKVFELNDDEYPIKMIGRTGLLVDAFGFLTNKGRELSFGGNGGGERELEAPPGLHFTRFGSVHSDGGVYSILAESSIIPDQKQDNKKGATDFDQLGTATKYIIDCLSIKDIFTLFKLNKYFASWRYSPIFLNKIAKRIIFTCNIQQREYIEIMMKNANSAYRSIQSIQKLLDITKNHITNPFGDSGYEGFQITKNGGSQMAIIHSNTQNYRTSAFITSFAFGELMFEAKLLDLFDEEFLTMLNQRKACIVGGCYMKQLGFGAEGYVQLIVKDDLANKVMANLSMREGSLPKEWKQFFLKFEKDDENEKFEATSIKLMVGGKDTCYWGGNYGNVMSGITLRGIPFYNKSDKQYLTL